MGLEGGFIIFMRSFLARERSTSEATAQDCRALGRAIDWLQNIVLAILSWDFSFLTEVAHNGVGAVLLN